MRADALDLIRKLRHTARNTRLGVVARRVGRDDLVEAVRLAGRRVFLKSTRAFVIMKGICHVLDGHVWCEPQLMAIAHQRIVDREAVEQRLGGPSTMRRCSCGNGLAGTESRWSATSTSGWARSTRTSPS